MDGIDGIMQAAFSSRPKKRTVATAMLCGDSMTRGGASAMDDTTLAWRGVFWEHLAQAGSGLRLLGQTPGGIYWVNAGSNGGPCKLGDWHVSATGGHTLAQINTAATTEDAATGGADVYILLGGENDNDGSAGCVATILSGIGTFVAARKAVNPNCVVLVGDLTFHTNPLAGFANKNTRRDAVNAQLPAYLASLGYDDVYMVAAGSLLTAAHITTDGQHPNPSGYAVIGRALGEAFLKYVSLPGSSSRRAPYFRKARARLSITATDNTANANITSSGSDGMLPTGNESWSFGLVFQPSDLTSASQQRIVSLGGAFGSSVYLFSERASGDSTGRSIGIWVAGVTYNVANEGLKQGKFHAITVAYDAVRTEMAIYCLREGGASTGGRPISSCVSLYRGVPTLALALGAGAAVFGFDANYGVVSKGLKGDFWIARGRAVTCAEAEAFYLDGAIPFGTTGYWPMDDGSGSTLAVAPGFTGLPAGVLSGVGQSWSAAGAVVEPWHRSADA